MKTKNQLKQDQSKMRTEALKSMGMYNSMILEAYFQSENEHWNKYVFKMLCEIFKKESFENPEIPLRLFSNSIDLFLAQNETPLNAVLNFISEVSQSSLSKDQEYFVYKSVYDYLRFTDFEGKDLSQIIDLILSQLIKIKEQQIKDLESKPIESNIGQTLKDIVKQEIEQMPETLKMLNPVQRLEFICKLMPYVVPKSEKEQMTIKQTQSL